jgi:hypothetical protein
MAKQPAEPERVGATSSTTFDDLRKQIAERNEQVHKEARELRHTSGRSSASSRATSSISTADQLRVAGPPRQAGTRAQMKASYIRPRAPTARKSGAIPTGSTLP